MYVQGCFKLLVSFPPREVPLAFEEHCLKAEDQKHLSGLLFNI